VASHPTRQHLRVDRLAVKCVTFKVGYATEHEAFEGAERTMLAGKVAPGCHIMPYLCADCGEWHVRNQRIVAAAPEDLSKRDSRRRDHA
jgi:hypothetical protein